MNSRPSPIFPPSLAPRSDAAAAAGGARRGRQCGRRTFSRRRGRRASTILLVLGILSLMIIVATALTLSSRLESVSAGNYADGVQSRMASKTGVSVVARSLAVSEPAAEKAAPARGLPVEVMSGPSNSSGSQLNLKAYGAAPNVGLSASETAPRALGSVRRARLSDVIVGDAAARLNVNTADETTLRKLLERVQRENPGVGGSAGQLAAAIVRARDVQSEQDRIDADLFKQTLERLDRVSSGAGLRPAPDASGAQPRALSAADLPRDPRRADIRYPAVPDQPRLRSLADLTKLPGATAAFVTAAAPYLTVFSVTREERPASTSDNAEGAEFVDPNTATVEEIHEALTELYGGTGGLSKNERLLKQFAVNIVDWRTPGDRPTVYPGTAGADAIIGYKRTPLITEVWPNSIHPDSYGTAGQFIEIYNPWDRSISLSGMSLDVDGIRISLTGTLEPGGYLIVTDRYDGSDLPVEKRNPFDSFYRIFNQVAYGSGRAVLEDRTLIVPRQKGIHTVELRDSSANLLDVFAYDVRRPIEGERVSYQRTDCRVRVSREASCTPFEPAPDTVAFRESNATVADGLPAGRPFLNAAELFTVFAGWADPFNPQTATVGLPVAATGLVPDPQYAAIAAAPYAIDARILDVFRVDPAALRALLLDSKRVVPDSLYGAATASDSTLRLPATLMQWTSSLRGARPVSLRVTPEATTNLDGIANLLATHSDKVWLQAALDRGDTVTAGAIAARTTLPSTSGTTIGGVNINSAPLHVLAALPGVGEDVATRWDADRRERLLTARTTATADSGMLFSKPTDILQNKAFWESGKSLNDRLAKLQALLAVTGFESESVFLDSRSTAAQIKNASRLPSTNRSVALMAYDRGQPEIVAWSPYSN